MIKVTLSNKMIRLATNNDINEIVKLNKECLSHFKWCCKHSYVYNAVNVGNYYVYEVDNKIKGAVKFYVEKNHLFINLIGVFKDYRKEGIGKKLINFVVKNAKKRKLSFIKLSTFTKSNSWNFFEKLGFVLIEEQNYYKENKIRTYQKQI